MQLAVQFFLQIAVILAACQLVGVIAKRMGQPQVVAEMITSVHAVFGAFIMGAAMPRGLVVRSLTERIEPLTVALLLPLFFTYSGLNTQIALLDSGYLWAMTGLVMLAAVGGKGVACWLAARATGISNREALGIGTLMNSRGLMELIIINIGLQRGIITSALFATLVIMAVATTLMASPLFELLVGKHDFAATQDGARDGDAENSTG